MTVLPTNVKGLFFSICFILLCSFSAAQKNESSVILVPVEVFVGDEACIIFTLPSDNFDFAPVQTAVPSEFSSVEKICTVHSIEILRKSKKLSVSVFIVPWAAGVLDLPPFTAHMSLNGTAESFFIDIPPVSVQSILTRVENPRLRPPRPPLIIPGTTYILYGAVLLFFLLLTVIVLLVLRYRRGGALRFRQRILLSRNYRKALRSLRKIRSQQDRIESAVFAFRLDRMLRRYFSVKLDEKFLSASSGEMRCLFQNVYNQNASLFEQAVHDVVLLFIRLDFVRFADSKHSETTMSKDEKRSAAEKAAHLLSVFEKGDFE